MLQTLTATAGSSVKAQGLFYILHPKAIRAWKCRQFAGGANKEEKRHKLWENKTWGKLLQGVEGRGCNKMPPEGRGNTGLVPVD